MDDDDPLEQLLDQLLDAHDRQQTAAPPKPATERPRRLRPAVIVFAALALLATASAGAALLVEGRRSAPLRARLPHQLLGDRYNLAVSPDLRAGHAGWCVALLDLRTGASVLTNPALCVSQGNQPLIARGGIQVLSPTTGAIGGWLLYAIVRKGVAGLRAPNNVRILPIASPSLPAGWRAAITVATNPSTGVRRTTIATLTPVDRLGRDLPTRTAKPIVVSTRAVNPRRPPRDGCRINARPLPGLRLSKARALSSPVPDSPTTTPTGFLTCYSVSLAFHGSSGTAALLVSAQRPGRRPGALPGAKPLRGNSHVELEVAGEAALAGAPPARLVAKRVGNGWLVIRTAATTDVALALLRDLSAHA